MINANLAAVALQLATTNKLPDEKTHHTVDRARAYYDFLVNPIEPVEDETKKSKPKVKGNGSDPVVEPTFEQVQQAGFALVNERGMEALASVLAELGVKNLKQLDKRAYHTAIHLLKEKLVEGDKLI